MAAVMPQSEHWKLVAATEAFSTAAPAFRIVNEKEAPPWVRIPFVLYGYRVGHSEAAALGSLFTLHADTVNIWLHLVGLLYFFSCFKVIDEVMSSVPGSTMADKAAFYVYTCCAMVLLVNSVIYHTFRCVSEWHSANLLRLDFIGILILFFGHAVMSFHTAFSPCLPAAEIAYSE